MKPFKKPLLAFILFLVIQLVVSFLVLIPVTFVYGIIAARQSGGMQHVDANALMADASRGWILAVTLIISSLVSIWFMASPLKMVNLRKSFDMPRFSAGKVLWLVIASFIGIFATDILSEILDLPNLIEAEMGNMSKTVLGVLAIGIIGPIAEEVTMRGAVQGWLHDHGVKPQWAILTSAVLFGLMHVNPAQVPFAMMVGLILGVIYWHTRSLLLPCVIHIFNNSFACVLMNIDGAEEMSLVELLGGVLPSVIVAIVCLLLCGKTLYRMVHENW